MKIEMGIGWMPDGPGNLRSATPAEYADEIERLRGENEKFRWHLETILQAADEPSCGWYMVSEITIDEARDALSAGRAP